MALSFPEHEDVVFGRAPLTLVLCQIRFSPILSLLDEAGVSGFQTALRNRYPELDSQRAANVAVSPNSAQMSVSAPTWRLHSDEDSYEVSLAVDFVAIETPKYLHFGEFSDRLVETLDAIDRTVHPGRSKRVGLRKVNTLSHPDVSSPSDWNDLLKPQLLGLAAVSEMPGHIDRDYSELHLSDDANGVLSIRHGVEPDDPSRYRLDLDYWTEAALEVSSGDQMQNLLRGYSDSMTGFFHWCLTSDLYQALEPQPRGASTDE